jgi:general secretion pathway protein A
MTYFHHFGLGREPFGTTPDPEMFYKTLGHEDCYERLKLAIHLQRGLSVIIGDVGYGKTTIKVALLQELQRDPEVEIGIINNPRDCRTDVQFLRAVLGQFGVAAVGRTGLDLTTDFLRHLEAMHLARRQVHLVIDEGQNLAGSQLEILRTFLSFETPTQKLINIVIFAQPELEEKIVRKRNLAQRVGMDHKLNPLNRRDTAGLIAHRLAIAGRAPAAPAVFDETAIDVIHERSRGIPRAITNFCADCLVEAVFLGRDRVDGALAAEVIGRRVFTGTNGDGPPHGANGHVPGDAATQTLLLTPASPEVYRS